MQTIKTILTVLALLCGAVFLLASWYVFIALAVIFALFVSVSLFYKVQAAK